MKSLELLFGEAIKNQLPPRSSREARELRTKALERFAALLDESGADFNTYEEVNADNPSIIVQFWNYYKTWLDANITEDPHNNGIQKAAILTVTYDKTTYYEVALINDALFRNISGS